MTVYQYCIIISLFFLGVTIYSLKKRKMEFSYGLIWLLIGTFLLVIALKPKFLELLAAFFGIAYSPSLLFVWGIIFNLVMTLYLTLKLSEIKKKLIRLTQEIGITKSELESGASDGLPIDSD